MNGLGAVRHSLLWRLTLPCMIGLVIVATAHTANWLMKFQTEIEAAFFKTGTETTQVMAEALGNAVWNFDQPNAAEILDGFAHVGGFTFGEILTDEGSFVHYGGLDGGPAVPGKINAFVHQQDQKTLSLENSVFFKQIIEHDSGREIGVLVTGFSYAPTRALMAKTWRDTVLSQVLGFGVLGIMLLLVLRGVTRPLRDITEVIDDVAAGDIDRVVPFEWRQDEVGRLAAAVSHFQRNARALVAVEAEAEVARRVAEQAVIDELTQLFNRRGLTNLFETLEANPGPERSIAILHMDLDGFKQINDTLGHKAGDQVLLVVADRLRRIAKDCRAVGRIGGDEFVAVVTGLDPTSRTVDVLADRLIEGLRQPTEFEGQSVRVGCSIGIAYHVSINRDLLETLVQADIALYKAKANGKNQWVEFDEEQRRAVIARKTLSDEIQQGLERNEFIPYFQPIVDAETNEIVALEVLSRWQHPKRGLVGPSVYIDLAQETKLLRFIDRTILEQSMAVMKSLAENLPHVPRLAVNVSTERMMETDLQDVARALAGTSVRLDLELLESSYIDDVADQVLWRIDALRDLGVGIHIDDFGTGHSSLAGLLRVSPDAIKIDRRFIWGATSSVRERAVIESMVGIAEKFEIKVVCEGIETQEQADLARELGCDMLQGYLLYRPFDYKTLRELLVDTGFGKVKSV